MVEDAFLHHAFRLVADAADQSFPEFLMPQCPPHQPVANMVPFSPSTPLPLVPFSSSLVQDWRGRKLRLPPQVQKPSSTVAAAEVVPPWPADSQ